MAKAKSKAIPAKRGTKKPTTRRTAPKPASPKEAPAPINQSAELVPITPEHQAKDGYREIELQAVESGVYAYVERPAGEKFKAGVVGDGPLPSWVREV